ncbi:MAG: hypothetical protein PVS3B3_28450 [Ktedonobacteraceae bacterium]
MLLQLQGHPDCTILDTIIVTHLRPEKRESVQKKFMRHFISTLERDTAPRLQDQVAIDCGAIAMNM